MTTATKEKPGANGTVKSPVSPRALENSTNLTPSSEMQREITIAEMVEKVNLLQQLLNRREALAEKRNELRKFKFGKDENSSVLTIIDQNNNEFRTANSNLIELLVNHLEKLITVKVDEITSEILDFEF